MKLGLLLLSLQFFAIGCACGPHLQSVTEPFLGISEDTDCKGRSLPASNRFRDVLARYEMIHAVKEVPAHWYDSTKAKYRFVEDRGAYIYFAVEVGGQKQIERPSDLNPGMIEVSDGDSFTDLYRYKIRKEKEPNPENCSHAKP